ncbi:MULTISPECIES: hypothetical protein [unclassified Rhizobium]|uniref:hypothetical protein n=1 Tax=unclassified Rhizobium TaxID=2613769 RepID=UPI001ADB72CB|nr:MULTISPECIES: hypothetical protein [unclassified Rhizobium]MBO9100013.1 hypothetical protein [Rhizobium sp. L58/93]QXZ82824.1 hypothetical protein J5287_12110 [Rhizobium sp. K1/93]QXZ89663.1 hypothetical protein J5280_16480 [Rhizobium sp. K15/93]
MHGPAGGRGKWGQAGVPKKGWSCVNIEDLGEPSTKCEMCEVMDIRYVHYMENDRYPDNLACGAICAGHMEENLALAEERDRSMKSNAGKRKRFPGLRAWRLSQNGNPTLKDGIFTVTVFKKGKYWKASVNNRSTDKVRYTRDIFETKEDAQRAAFDTLELVKKRHRERS